MAKCDRDGRFHSRGGHGGTGGRWQRAEQLAAPQSGEHARARAQTPGGNHKPDSEHCSDRGQLWKRVATATEGSQAGRGRHWLEDPARQGRIPWRPPGHMPRGPEAIPQEDKTQEESTQPSSDLSRTSPEKRERKWWRGLQQGELELVRGSHSGLSSAGEGITR